ncbi:hypothetical protein ABZV34_33770, partial [Streptomyces sp. NPDC005195]|uniref:hypothetical protein n=1 Tax=Streptomyces sp. NPDC005195 TaxID=3154561 RepID=UPI0033AFC218
MDGGVADFLGMGVGIHHDAVGAAFQNRQQSRRIVVVGFVDVHHGRQLSTEALSRFEELVDPGEADDQREGAEDLFLQGGIRDEPVPVDFQQATPVFPGARGARPLGDDRGTRVALRLGAGLVGVVDAWGEHGTGSHDPHARRGRLTHLAVSGSVDGEEDGRLEAGLADVDEHSLGEAVTDFSAACRRGRGEHDVRIDAGHLAEHRDGVRAQPSRADDERAAHGQGDDVLAAGEGFGHRIGRAAGARGGGA